MRKFYILVALLATFLFTQAQSGMLDASFGDGGIVTTSITDQFNIAKGMAIQADGKIIVCGNVGPSNSYDVGVARYNEDGTLDDTFGTGGEVVIAPTATLDFAFAVALQDDGKIVLGGYIFDGDGTDVLLIRLNADGTMDDMFGTNGIVITDFGGTSEIAEAIALQDDGKILLGGYHNDNFMMLRYNTDGTLDNTYGTGGLAIANVGVASSYIQSIALQPDGKIVAVGMGFNASSHYGFAVARFNTDGTVDNTFADNGSKMINVGGGNDFGSAVLIQSDNKILLAGHTWIENDPILQYDFAVTRLNEDGSTDNTFGESGTAITNLVYGGNYVTSMALQPDGKIIVNGNTTEPTAENLGIIRYTADGILDTSFGTNGMTLTNVAGNSDYSEAVLVQDDGKILTAGYTFSGSYSEFLLVRYTNDEITAPAVNITPGEITNTTVQATFEPNFNCANYFTLISTQEEMENWSAMMGVSIDSLVQMWGIEFNEEFTYLWNGLIPNTEYTIYARPYGTDGIAYPLNTITVTTLGNGGSGLSEMDVQLSEITDVSVRLIATPNDQTAVFFDGLITVEYYNQIGEEAAIAAIQNNGYPQYETDDWVWLDLTPGTDYFAIAIGQNANDEWGPATIVPFTTLPWVGVDHIEGLQTASSIFPLPNNGDFTFVAPNNEAGTISIFNANGQLVFEQKVSGQQDAINANHLNNGLYHLRFTSESSELRLNEKLLITK